MPMALPARRRAAFTSRQSARPQPACMKWACTSMSGPGPPSGGRAPDAGRDSSGTGQLLLAQGDERRARRVLDVGDRVVVVGEGGEVVRAPLEQHALGSGEREEAPLA